MSEIDEGAGIRIDNDRIWIGWYPGDEKWMIETIGQVKKDVVYTDDGRIEVVRLPGWHMRRRIPGPNGLPAYISLGPDNYLAGPHMWTDLRVGGWTVDELVELTAGSGTGSSMGGAG